MLPTRPKHPALYGHAGAILFPNPFLRLISSKLRSIAECEDSVVFLNLAELDDHLLHFNVLCISSCVSDAELLPILEQLIVGGDFLQDLAFDLVITLEMRVSRQVPT